jgi:hypothetical protein
LKFLFVFSWSLGYQTEEIEIVKCTTRSNFKRNNYNLCKDKEKRERKEIKRMRGCCGCEGEREENRERMKNTIYTKYSCYLYILGYTS